MSARAANWMFLVCSIDRSSTSFACETVNTPNTGASTLLMLIVPEGEKILVGGERPDAGCIGICSPRGSRLQGIGPSDSQMRQRSCPAVPDNAAVIDNLLKLGDSSRLG